MYLTFLIILIFIACILIELRNSFPYYMMAIITILLVLNELYIKTNKKNMS